LAQGRKKGSPAVKAVYDAMEAGDQFPTLDAETWDYSGCVEKEDALYGRGHQRSVVTPKGIDICRKLRSMHYNLKLVAYLIGLKSSSTLKDCAKRQPELAEALEAGEALSEAHLVTTVVRAANSGFAPAAMFLLKCMHGYRENDAPQNNVSNVTIQLPASMTLEQMRQLKAEGLTVNQLPQSTEDELVGEVVDNDTPH
jgi:hypothetical protein